MTAHPPALPQFAGVLYFPVTPFTRSDAVNEDLLSQLVRDGFDSRAGAAFLGCGTGEYHALSSSEYAQVIRAGLAGAVGHGPAIAGVGGPLGHARDCARVAEEAGADGLLVMPPYLVSGPQAGLVDYFEAIGAVTSLPLIAYHRGSGTLSDDAVCRLLENPQLAGIKDGVGDVALMQRFVLAAGRLGRSDVQFFNGLLTAEASQAAYRAIGVPLYSSATFAMSPAIANAFYAAYIAGDHRAQRDLLDGFYSPLIALRDETPGFAVSLIKAGLRFKGWDVGSVRAPLVDPTAEQTARLSAILDRGEQLAQSMRKVIA
ncbi:5-dehydro-4-deoxyglucarate dehydratase [Ruania rhizosphaerae]|uniref:5-dehydro-4-deoxyglucarate dehydratase n=1 Tax=Ruania rhizosphaerae TaxID=1840413 RepID=UPI00135AEAA0|nr:5-dehydro-4-deoxyglucarate dehydratase [Ruania rhizosphaerae]